MRSALFFYVLVIICWSIDVFSLVARAAPLGNSCKEKLSLNFDYAEHYDFQRSTTVVYRKRVETLERRRMKDLREEVGTKACVVGKIFKSWMKWAERMVRMKDERLPKRSETRKQEGCRKRGRPQVRYMGGLFEERYEKGRGRRKVGRKSQQQGNKRKNNVST